MNEMPLYFNKDATCLLFLKAKIILVQFVQNSAVVNYAILEMFQDNTMICLILRLANDEFCDG